MNEPVHTGKPGRKCILCYTVTLYQQVRLPSLSACWIEFIPVTPCQPSVLPHMRVAPACMDGLNGSRRRQPFGFMSYRSSFLPFPQCSMD